MIHTTLIVDKVGRKHSSIVVGIQCAGKVCITRVSRAMKQKTMSMVAIIYIAGKG